MLVEPALLGPIDKAAEKPPADILELSKCNLISWRGGQATKRDLDREPEEPARQLFKNYVPGFVCVDVKYLPPMPDQASGRYRSAGIGAAQCEHLIPRFAVCEID